MLLDIGTHLVDQALILFGKPQAVGAEVLRERAGNGSDDSFTLRLRYPDLSVTLSGNCLASLARPFYYLRGTKGNYWKWGLDLQEAALTKITRIDSKTWGQEPPANWGTLQRGRGRRHGHPPRRDHPRRLPPLLCSRPRRAARQSPRPCCGNRCMARSPPARVGRRKLRPNAAKSPATGAGNRNRRIHQLVV